MLGIDNYFMDLKGYKIASGRNFNKNEFDQATNVCVLGVDVIDQLFEKNNPIDKEITANGIQLKVIGILEKKGNMMGGGDDRVILVPLETGRKMSAGRELNYDITTSAYKVQHLDDFMEEA